MQLVRTALERFFAQTTRRAWVMTGVLAVVIFLAFATGEGVLYRVTYFLALVLVGGYAWAHLNLWRLHMRVEEQPSVAQVGDTLEGSIYVRNDSFLPVSWVEIVQVSDMPGHVCGGAAQLPSRGWEAWRTERGCYSRGVYTIGPLMARTSDPLGLFRIEKAEGVPIKVTIYPRVVELPYCRLPVAGLSGEEKVLRRPQTRTAQASTVREYSHNDSVSLIHWPSTAKWNQLMCKEFDSGGHGDVWIVLDLQRQVQESMETEKTDEYAVATAASLAHLALTEERSVGLIAYGDEEYLLSPGNGSKQMSGVLETLAISRTEGNVGLSDLLQQNAVRFGRLGSLLVVTSSTNLEWVTTLQRLSYSGLRIMVVLVDPASFGGDRSCYEVVMGLADAGIPAYIIRRGDLLPLALSRPMNPRDLHMFEQNSQGELIAAPEA